MVSLPKICIAFIALLSVFSGAAVAQQQPLDSQQQQPPALGVPIDVNYVLGLGDVIEVGIIGRTDYTTRARVGPDGRVQLALVGAIPAVNKTATELAEDIRIAMEKGKFFSQVAIRVDVIAVASRYVTVLGQVGNSSLIPLDRAYRLSEILAKVGAGSATADYVIVTSANGKQTRYQIAQVATGNAEQDPAVVPGDKIYFPSLANEIFYISGQVKAPGSFSLTPGLTLRAAIARAGGVTEMGSERKVDVYRNGKKVRKPSLESLVEIGDIIKIGERMF